MPTVFTVREIAESAVEKEMKRRDFYANVTKLSTNPEMTKLFEFLAAEEDRHVATFVKLRDQVPVRQPSALRRQVPPHSPIMSAPKS